MMKKTFALFLLGCAASFPAMAKDSLYLKNGDKLSGSVSAYSNGMVSLKTSYGDFTIPVADLSGVETVNDAIQAQVEQAIESASAAPVLTPPAVPNTVIAAAPAPADVSAKKPEAKSDDTAAKKTMLFGAEITGTANIGAGLRTGNSETNSINVDGSVKARWEKHRTSVSADYNREEEDSTLSVDDRMVGLEHDYFFAPKWFVQGAGELEQDDIAALDLRTSLSAGLGYQAYERDDLKLSFVAGPGYRKEEYENGTDDSYLTGEWQLDYSQKFFEDAFRLFHNHDLSVPTDDTGAYVFESETGVRIPLRKGIIASGQIDFDWQNEPPVGTKEDDTKYSLKLGYEW